MRRFVNVTILFLIRMKRITKNVNLTSIPDRFSNHIYIFISFDLFSLLFLSRSLFHTVIVLLENAWRTTITVQISRNFSRPRRVIRSLPFDDRFVETRSSSVLSTTFVSDRIRKGERKLIARPWLRFRFPSPTIDPRP